MSARQPPGMLTPSAPSVASDNSGLDRRLADALRDTSLPAETRALLRKLSDELDATRAAVGAERMRYRALFDAVPDPVSVLARDGTVLDLNKAGMTAYKRPREEVVGKNIDVLNPDLPRDHMVPVLDTLDRGETYVIDGSHTTPMFEIRHMNMSIQRGFFTDTVGTIKLGRAAKTGSIDVVVSTGSVMFSVDRSNWHLLLFSRRV